jgi:apolipoprotein N-acyltransferase
MNSGTGKAVASLRFVWLGLGVALLLVANGRWMLPLASWFCAIGWLVFLERSRRLFGLAVALVAYVLVYFVVWQGIIPAPGVLYYLIAALYAVVFFLPFVAHRLVASRIAGFGATLVLPTAWVSAEFLFSRWGTPYGSWTSLAYTQSEHLLLLQLTSVTGIAGVTFMMTWFGSIVAWMLRPGLAASQRLRGGAAFAVVLIAILSFGQVRLVQDGSGARFRTASLVPASEALAALEQSLSPVRRGEAISDSTMTAIAAAADRLNNDLFERTLREAKAGARLVTWSETASRVLASEEQQFIDRARRLAAEQQVILLLGVGVWRPETVPPFENKVIAIDAAGSFVWEFHKAHPIIGAESPFIAAGTGQVRAFEADFGKVGAVICHDLDFARLIRQASAERIGLLVAPSADWRDVADLHARMAVFRAVENGVNMLRPTSGGRSVAFDTRGRVIARLDFPDDAMVAHVSAVPVRTVYGMVGDLFSWLCVLAFAVLFLAVVSGRAGALAAQPDVVTASPEGV